MQEHAQQLVENARHAALKIALAATAVAGVMGITSSSTEEASHKVNHPALTETGPTDSLPRSQIEPTPPSDAAEPIPQRPQIPETQPDIPSTDPRSPKEPEKQKNTPKESTPNPDNKMEATPGTGVTDIPTITFPEPETAPETKESTELLRFNAETAISPEASKVMDEHTVYLEAMGCSGFTIPNIVDGSPNAAVVFTGHCLKENQFGTDTNGNATLDLGKPFLVQSGYSVNATHTVGEITKVILPKDPNSNDYAIGVLDDTPVNEAYASVKAVQATPEEIAAQAPGIRTWNAGYPVYQPNNQGATHIQKFNQTGLGVVDANVGNGRNWTVFSSAVKINEEGAVPSGGISGGGTFTLNENAANGWTLIGVNSAYNDFGYLLQTNAGAGEQIRSQTQGTFNVSMDGFDAVSSAFFTMPDLDNGDAFVAEVIPHKGAEVSPLGRFQIWYTEQLVSNDQFKKQFVRGGTVQIASPKGDVFIKDSLYAIDEESKHVIFASCEDSKFVIRIDAVPFESLDLVTFHQDGDIPPETATSTEKVELPEHGQPLRCRDAKYPDGYGEFLPIDHLDIPATHRFLMYNSDLHLEQFNEYKLTASKQNDSKTIKAAS